ncbi:unnamed protein product [Ranitomeya imitator]|uniref:Uncharacterized protein n=1 Tax=Ranitomeya imitator TaxID=111125 RepID=A0ABN9MGF5_9NEOB|nr:unnamed protein product [Ranitomeya imitator]
MGSEKYRYRQAKRKEKAKHKQCALCIQPLPDSYTKRLCDSCIKSTLREEASVKSEDIRAMIREELRALQSVDREPRIKEKRGYVSPVSDQPSELEEANSGRSQQEISSDEDQDTCFPTDSIDNLGEYLFGTKLDEILTKAGERKKGFPNSNNYVPFYRRAFRKPAFNKRKEFKNQDRWATRDTKQKATRDTYQNSVRQHDLSRLYQSSRRNKIRNAHVYNRRHSNHSRRTSSVPVSATCQRSGQLKSRLPQSSYPPPRRVGPKSSNFQNDNHEMGYTRDRSLRHKTKPTTKKIRFNVPGRQSRHSRCPSDSLDISESIRFSSSDSSTNSNQEDKGGPGKYNPDCPILAKKTMVFPAQSHVHLGSVDPPGGSGSSFPGALQPPSCEGTKVDSLEFERQLLKLRGFSDSGQRKGSGVTKGTLSRWIREAIYLAYSSKGENPPETVKAHSTRAIASSWAERAEVPIELIFCLFSCSLRGSRENMSTCAKELLVYNADINYVGGGQTPLYLACKNGNCETVKLLLDSGANRNIATNTGWTPVHAAADSGNTDCLKLLMYYGGRSHCDSHKEFDVRLYDLKNQDNGNLEAVISATLINSADSEGWTAAHIAASKGFKYQTLENL